MDLHKHLKEEWKRTEEEIQNESFGAVASSFGTFLQGVLKGGALANAIGKGSGVAVDIAELVKDSTKSGYEATLGKLAQALKKNPVEKKKEAIMKLKKEMDNAEPGEKQYYEKLLQELQDQDVSEFKEGKMSEMDMVAGEVVEVLQRNDYADVASAQMILDAALNKIEHGLDEGVHSDMNLDIEQIKNIVGSYDKNTILNIFNNVLFELGHESLDECGTAAAGVAAFKAPVGKMRKRLREMMDILEAVEDADLEELEEFVDPMFQHIRQKSWAKQGKNMATPPERPEDFTTNKNYRGNTFGADT